MSKSEIEQCENAINMVKNTLVEYGYNIKSTRKNYNEKSYSYYYELSNSNNVDIIVLLQGSYANNTNIERYSDVDVSVIYRPNLIPISIDSIFSNFKLNIYNALKKKIGADVERKNDFQKSFFYSLFNTFSTSLINCSLFGI